jgi:EAL domain-containing protein (putative c-di-GMP-specific phosphodiesterase class I)
MTEAPTVDDVVRRAATGEGLRTVFQPVVDLRRLTVTGYEALSRFDVPGAPGPEAALGAAADLGILPELEARCLRSALARRDELPSNCFLAVNVEPQSVGTGPVAEVFEDAGDLRGIVVEVTERRAMDDAAAFARTLETWRDRGAKVAVDDAGAGHSGLQKILALRPEFLKLDGSLVRGIEGDEAKAALVEMIGVFADRIDAWLLAEGVETLADARRLSALRVPLAQGRYLGPAAAPWEPVRPEACAALRAARSSSPGALLPLVQTVRHVRAGDEASIPADVFAGIPGVAILVDAHGGPLGLIDRPVAAGEPVRMLRPLRVNVHTEAAELAHRLGTRVPPDTHTPVVVTDDAGRALGVVTVARLLGAIAGDP